ncbi:MAG: helicase-related protein [Chitinophagales bacterium]
MNTYSKIMQRVEQYTFYNHLLAQHLRGLKETFGEKGCVFVYKGFPLSFMQQVQQTFTSISQANIIHSDGNMNLEQIKTNPLGYITSIQQVQDNHVSMWYEEFLIFSRNINPTILPVRFVIIDNNFFKFYPNPSNHPFTDLEKAIDSEKEFEDDELFNEFYSDSTVIGNIMYVQYPDIDIEDWSNVTKINFFDTNGQKLETTSFTEGMDTTDFVQFQMENTSWLNLKYQVYAGLEFNEPVKLLLDNTALRNEHSKQELLILQQIFKAADISYNFCYRKDFYADYYRPELLNILNNHWASNEFRNLKVYEDPDISTNLVELSQGAVCEHVIKQCEIAYNHKLHEDVFLTAPTGAGKSVLFQVPAIYMAEKYNLVTIVVSPLKALMLDQVSALRDERGYSKVGFINSDISLVERENVLNSIKNGTISIVYLSPELLLSYDIKYFVGTRQVGLLVIDEAHLVTTWGRDFRVDYWFLGNYIRKARKYLDASFPVFAVTATAVYNGPNDMVFDTINSLNMQNCRKFIGYVRRDDIGFDIRRFELPTNSHENDKVNQTALVIRSFLEKEQKAIVYFPWISTINDVIRMLSPDERLQIGGYHSQANAEIRNKILSDFKSNKIKVVLATKAFGMGVDISDIQIVYHHAPSGTIADYVQEIGRVARRADIHGVAEMDFNPRDLKFSRILFGLSSLKQWQVKLVLEKLNNIYRLNRRRNFLVSIDDFAHIFPNNDQPEQKVKSALLVLEKDLLAKYRYNVLVVRPKSLFSTVFVRVNNDEKEEFLNQFGSFVQQEEKAGASPFQQINSHTVVLPNNNNTRSSIFKIQLDKIWESKYADEGFPSIKHKFFTKQLFEGFSTISPQFRLNILFNQEVSSTLTELTRMFQTLEKVLYSFQGYFLKDKLYTELNRELKNEALARNLSNLLIAMYSDNNNFGRQGQGATSNGAFIQKRFNTGKNQDEYRVLNQAFEQVKHHSRQRFQTMFGGSSEIEQVQYIPADSDKNKEVIKLAYIMEMFGLCTYEIVGGEQPQIFIRINDPLKITRLARSRTYDNNVINFVDRRFQLNVNLMTHFFLHEKDDQERWQFIEDYFLGKTEEELIQG